MASHKVTTQWQKNMLFQSDNPSGHTIAIDAGKETGGDNAGARPKALMLSALAGCSGLDVVSLLNKMRVEFTSFKIEVIADLTEEHPKHYHTVTVNYYLSGNKLDENKVHKAINLSVEKYCGVMEMFRKFATIKTNVFIDQQ